jgi:uncharacterized protein (DUF58 family)
MNAWLADLLKDYGPALVRWAGLLLILGAAPLLALAWFKKIYPHTPLVVALAAPAIMTLLLLVQPGLLPIIAIVDVVILVAALADLFTLPRKSNFAIDRETTRVVSVQKNHAVTIHISNLGQRPRTAWIRDDIPQEFEPTPKEFVLRLAPRSRATVHYELKATKRGKFTLECINLRVRSLLGLWQRLLIYPQKNELHVYPDMRQLAEYAILARTNRLSLMGVRRTRRVGLENDFERLRDYTLDDNFRYIDWRASARRLKLTVKDFQTSQSQRIMFLLDCGRLMTNESSGLSLLDHSLNAALLMSYVALRQGDSVGMIAFSDRVIRYVPPRGGMKQMNQLLHASFDRFPELIESRYDDAFLYLNTHLKKRSLVVLISNVIDEVNAHQIERYLQNLVGRHLPLGVLLRDRRLFAAADRDPATDDELYEAAAASELLLWRHQVLRDLERRGVMALDVFPEDMTAPLVNSYLEIKARQLL